jgi:ATP-dependent Clp protease ATP-binding subunit ClpX
MIMSLDVASRPPEQALLASIPTPKQIVAYLDQTVVGQDRAKRRLAIAVSNHYIRLLDALDRTSPAPIVVDASLREVAIEKSNILLIGPSGSGKTLLAKTLAEYLSVPFAIADATTLTEAGYVGEDVESILYKLLIAADMDVQAAQGGIIYIDEIDKLTGGRVHGKDLRLGVQHALLKMIEGSIVNVPPSGGYRMPGETATPFDTTNILFICGGAFVGLEGIVSRRHGGGGIGFDRTGREEAERPLHHVLPEDLEGFGLIPELIGRLPVIVTLDALGVDDLVRILQEPKNSLLGQYRKLLAYHGADLEFTPGAIREVARIAHARLTGARGLRAVVEQVVEGVLFDPSPWVTYRITEATVRGEQAAVADWLVGESGSSAKRADPAAPLRHKLVRRTAQG